MVHHLREATLSDRLVDRIVAHKKDIIDGSDRLEERTLVYQNGLREN